ncbi:MAG: cytochrome b N-terminal domain-containing protein, partial [Pseudomonadota bacterium]
MHDLLSMIRRALARFERLFEIVFGAANPFYHLGALTFFFFWVVIASGIYLYIFFETSLVGAFRSVEQLTHEQWYLGGVMRSLHRYASDALMLTMTLHLLRELVLGRFRGFRAFSWVTGVPLIWLVFFSGINGYWLVWDRLAQYIAIATTEWLDWLGIFGEPIARNFLHSGAVSDRFFTLLVFLHIGVPLFLLAFTYVHVARISRPKTSPPQALVFGTSAALLALAFFRP